MLAKSFSYIRFGFIIMIVCLTIPSLYTKRFNWNWTSGVCCMPSFSTVKHAHPSVIGSRSEFTGFEGTWILNSQIILEFSNSFPLFFFGAETFSFLLNIQFPFKQRRKRSEYHKINDPEFMVSVFWTSWRCSKRRCFLIARWPRI